MTEQNTGQTMQSLLHDARMLVQSIEADNFDEANRLLDQMVRAREYDLFQELGKLTRNLHEALNSFRLDARLNRLAEYEIPDAKERLNHVVTLTEQAANRTLNALDEIDPICRHLEERTGELDTAWQRFRRRQMAVDEFREMAQAFDTFMADLRVDIGKVRGHLSEVMMAQDFQDLTGQIIRRVIALVQELEVNLVDLVRIGGERLKGAGTLPTEEKASEAVAATQSGFGPNVPTVDDQSKVVTSQDDVDDLLSSLGF